MYMCIPYIHISIHRGSLEFQALSQVAGYHDVDTMCCMEEQHFKELGMLPGHVLKLKRP